MLSPHRLQSVYQLEYLNDGVSYWPLHMYVCGFICVYVCVCARADTERAGQTHSEGSVL